MWTRTLVVASLVAISASIPYPSSADQAPPELGTFSIAAPKTYIADREARRRLALVIRRAVATTLGPLSPTDPTKRRRLLVADRAAALTLDDWRSVITRTREIREIEPKPAMKQLEGIVVEAIARAALEVRPSPKGFEQQLRQSVEVVDGATAASALRALRSSYFFSDRSSALAVLNGRISDELASRNGNGDLALASSLLEQLFFLEQIVPYLPAIERVMAHRLSAADMRPIDRWSERQAALPPNRAWSSVVVGIWDSGIDTELFKGQLWRNPGEKLDGHDDDANGFVDDVHGFAFDVDRQPTTGMLGELPTADQAGYDRLASYAVGASDLDVGEATNNAAAARSLARSLTSIQRMQLDREMSRLSFFTHGTGIASIAMDGNPAAQLMVGRMAYRLGAVPQPIDEKDASARVAYADKAIGYFRRYGARVVNMSFRLTLPNVEGSLAPIEADLARRRARASTIYDNLHMSFERAVRSAPEILFVTSAGNSNENNDTVRSFPAGIDADNVIVVGAVDAALMPADISSFGKSVDIYALGVAAPQKLVGGRTIRFTGTSSAAPQVTNLALKLLTVCPNLTVAQLKDVILSTGTYEGPQRLRVVNPRAALARVKACPN